MVFTLDHVGMIADNIDRDYVEEFSHIETMGFLVGFSSGVLTCRTMIYHGH